VEGVEEGVAKVKGGSEGEGNESESVKEAASVS